MEEKTCKFCSNILSPIQDIFCSNKCTNSWRGQHSRSRALADYFIKPNLCQNCQNPIIPSLKESINSVRKRKYCGSSCSAKHANRINPKRKPEGYCKTCMIPIRSKSNFCSSNCRHKSKYFSKIRRLEELKKLASSNNMPYTELVSKLNSLSVVDWRKRTKIKSIQYKGGSCVVCGYSKSIRALHFHHLDSSKKDFTISGKSLSWDKIKNELDKCILVCANCHAEIHDGLLEFTNTVTE